MHVSCMYYTCYMHVLSILQVRWFRRDVGDGERRTFVDDPNDPIINAGPNAQRFLILCKFLIIVQLLFVWVFGLCLDKTHSKFPTACPSHHHHSA